MGFFSHMPDKPSADEIKKQKEKGKVPHTQCEGRGMRSVGGKVIRCEGCKGTGFI